MCYWIPASAGMTTNELIRVSLSVLVRQVGNTAIPLRNITPLA
jgi:hypothetical protein